MSERSSGEQVPPALRLFIRVLIRPALALPLPHRLRRAWFELLARLDRPPEGVRISALRLGGLPAERTEPQAPGPGAILYLHGGGYTFGSPRTQRSISARLALGAETTTYTPAYRRAPEHPFPAALDDAFAAYQELVARAGGEAPALAGDSAGGNLALVLALRVRDAGFQLPAALCLFCPWLDLDSNGALAGHDRDTALPRAFVVRGAREYLAGHDPRDPLCSPVFADLSGLPPILVHAAAGDILLPDAERLAERATEAGVEVELRRFNGLWHDFHAQAGALPAGAAAIAEAGKFLRGALDRATP